MSEDFYRLTSNVNAAGMEWFAVFSFVAFSVVYFLAPVLGYQPAKRSLLLMSLYLLLGYGLIVLLHLIVQYFFYLMGSTGRAPLHVATLLAILKITLFVASQASFVLGLQGLRRGSDAS